MATIEQITRSYWKAEETRDVDAIMDHFAEDATWVGPGDITLTGREQIRRFYADTGREFPGLEVEVVGVVGDERAAALEFQAVLIDHDGQCHPLRGVNVMQGDGERITSLHAYYDRAQVALKLDDA